MSSPLPLPRFFEALRAVRAEGAVRTTLLGIGPMSERILRVTLQSAAQRQFPVMFIASRNQVDLQELGGGYVRSWDQSAFLRSIRQAEQEAGFSGLCYVCRDHGGPWQRDEERRAKLPPAQAMEIAKRSFREDLLQGFDLLHVDPTKDPHARGSADIETVIQRTVELIEYVEGERSSRNLPPVCYEVGTEETSGGLTSTKVYGSFIEKLNALLDRKDLPRPVFIVGQTGTLVRMTENAGRFDAAAARALAALAVEHGTGLKEHNADYLGDDLLLRHPALGITAANVAPEFGVEETRAYLQLAEVEEREYRHDGRSARTASPPGSPSQLAEILSRKAVGSERWRKWMIGEEKDASVQRVEGDPALRRRITAISGHYVFDDPEVRASLDRLRANLAGLGIDAERYADWRVRTAIERYVSCFNLGGLTPKLLEYR